MKYFQILLLLGINISTILLSQSIEIPHRMMSMQDTTINIPIFIYEVDNLESIDLTIEYDASIILAKGIIENPVGILDGGYTFTLNLTEPGIIHLGIGSNSAILFSGDGMVAQIIFNKPISNTPEFSAVTFLDAQINSDWQVLAVDGSIEIILPFSITITGQDNSDIGAEHSITLGLCDGCSDGWKYGEDEYDYPNPTTEYTNIHFYHPEWVGEADSNGVVCNNSDIATDKRNQHSLNELISWGIRGFTGGGLDSTILIKLSWDSNKLNNETSDNFQMFIYVGETRHDMKEQNSIIISQSELNLSNNEPNIKVKMGGCHDTYYQDSDGDGLGSDITAQYCSGDEPDGWVSNHTDQNDELYCLSNNIDDCEICDGNNDCVDCNGIVYGDTVIDCSGDCDGDAEVDECGICAGGQTGELPCEMDCNGDWGGPDNIPDSGDEAIVDECNLCGGNENNGNDICDIICSPNNEAPDCNGDCDGDAEVDECGICVGGQTGNSDCIQDCNGGWGGSAIEDECGICGGSGIANGECDCDGNVNLGCGCGAAGPSGCNNTCGSTLAFDECGVCGGEGIPDGACDCDGSVEDCSGVCSGLAFTDDCGECDSNNTNNNQCFDCNFVKNGGAIIDNCYECISEGENTTCEMDCNGDWGGPDNIPDSGDEAIVDECNICGGNENNGNDICDIICSPNNEAPDCNGDCNGDAEVDECGICVGGQTGNSACIEDCNYVWGGNYTIDLCGICDADSGNNNQCVDCNGTVNGLAEIDYCGTCVEDLSDSSYECEQDCDGIWGGNHPPTFSCENGDITCNYDACFDLANDDFLLPQKFDISRIYPNPFNPQATIDFEVSEPTMVQLNIYNLKGQKVEVLKDAFTLPGHYSVIWNGTNHPSGIYFVILQNSNSIIKQKMMLIK